MKKTMGKRLISLFLIASMAVMGTTVTMTIKNADKAIVYAENANGIMERSDVTLTNGQYQVTLNAGQAAFVIPYNE